MLGSDIGNGNGYSPGRWPREETLTLLEIRTRLHPKFKLPTAQKASLWDEVSRIMAEEHGYQRSGKKCKEKLDNLCKYYRKTKADNRDCQNGRNYRFFRQLEALYGGNNNNNTNTTFEINQEPDHDHSVSSDDEEEEDDEMRVLIKMQVRRVMEVQERWMERMVEVVERMEQERVVREEAWRRREEARREREERVRECERAWIQARDAVLVEALERVVCKRGDGRDGSKSAMRDDGGDDEIGDLIRSQNWMQMEM